MRTDIFDFIRTIIMNGIKEEKESTDSRKLQVCK